MAVHNLTDHSASILRYRDPNYWIDDIPPAPARWVPLIRPGRIVTVRQFPSACEGRLKTVEPVCRRAAPARNGRVSRASQVDGSTSFVPFGL